MPRFDYAICRNCDGHRSEVGPLSRTRLCEKCGLELLAENVTGIATKSGAPFRRWRTGMILCAGGSLPEQLQPRS